MNYFQEAVDSCIDCDRCGDVCPVTKSTGNERFTPKEKIRLLSKIVNGEELEKEEYDNIYLSTICGACEDACPVDIPITDIIRYERKLLTEQGKEPERTGMLANNILKHKSPRGNAPGPQRLEWITDDLNIAEKSEIGYMTGCWISFSQPQIAQSTIKILNRAGIEPMVLKEEKCCGLFLIDNGMSDRLKDYAKEYVDYIESLGIKKLVTSCPGCYLILGEEYPKLYRELEFEVIPSIELFKQFIDEGKLQLKKIDLSATIRDSCAFKDRADIPRYILSKMGIDVNEMFDGEPSCCGGPGGVKPNFPEISSEIAMMSVEEARRISEVMVTYCPFCMHHIGGVCKEKGEDANIKDISELLAESIM